MKTFAEKMNEHLQTKMNHWIVTSYADQNDCIGFHSDKYNDFAPSSYFVVIKMGDPRKFEFRRKRTEECPNPVPFFPEVLQPGTAIFVRSNCDGVDANSVLEHGVPPMKVEIGRSGSIVGRTIITRFSWEQVKTNVERSRRNKEKMAQKKLLQKKDREA